MAAKFEDYVGKLTADETAELMAVCVEHLTVESIHEVLEDALNGDEYQELYDMMVVEEEEED